MKLQVCNVNWSFRMICRCGSDKFEADPVMAVRKDNSVNFTTEYFDLSCKECPKKYRLHLQAKDITGEILENGRDKS